MVNVVKQLKIYCFSEILSTNCLRIISFKQKYLTLQNNFQLDNFYAFPKAILHQCQRSCKLVYLCLYSSFVYSMSHGAMYCIDCAIFFNYYVYPYVYLYMCIYLYVYIPYIHIYVYIYKYIYIYTYMCIYVYIFIYAFIYIYTYVMMADCTINDNTQVLLRCDTTSFRCLCFSVFK